MFVPHPFRTVRHTGTPNAGGNMHTLESHIGSSAAHPQYMKKGDEVGGFDINAHINSVNAHRQYYLRRLELATEVSEYNAYWNTDVSNYTGENPSHIDSIYRTIVTSHLLHTLLVNDTRAAKAQHTFIPSMFTWDRIITSYVVDELGHETMMYASEWGSDVPSMDIFKELYRFTHDLLSEDSPLFDMFARAEHTHSIYDVTDPLDGMIPARKDHDHDDVYALLKHDHPEYWRHDEDISASIDLSMLSDVGIYPASVPAEVKASSTGTGLLTDPSSLLDGNPRSLNARTVQGNTTYIIDSSTAAMFADGGAPEDLLTAINTKIGTKTKFVQTTDTAAMESTANDIKYTAVLNVIQGESAGIDFVEDNVSSYISGNPTGSKVHQVVSQVLICNTGIKDFLRDGGDDIMKAVQDYKRGTRQVYWRTGFSLETAWYIDAVLNIIGKTPGDFYNEALNSNDPIVKISDTVNKVLHEDITAAFNDSVRDLRGLTVGLYVPSNTEHVRASMTMWQSAQIAANIETRQASVTYGQITAHDISDWVAPAAYTVTSSNVLPGNATAFAKWKEMKVLGVHSRQLPHQLYYQLAAKYKGTDLSQEIIITNAYYSKKDGEYTAMDLSVAPLTAHTTDAGSTATMYVDQNAALQHEYRGVTSAENYVVGTKYYKISGKDKYGCNNFVEMVLNTDYKAGNAIPQDGTVFKRYVLKSALERYVWSKRPVQRATKSGTKWVGDKVVETATYYTYNSLRHTFRRLDSGYSLSHIRTDGLVPCEEDGEDFAVPIYTDYEIYDKTLSFEKSLPVRYEIKPVTRTGTKFLRGVEYVKYINNDGDATKIKNVEVLYEGITPPEDTTTIHYVNENSVITFSGSNYTYGIRVPVWAVAINNTAAPTYCAAYFFASKDTSAVANKKYYIYDGDMHFSLYNASGKNPAALGLHEIINLETFYDMWCAIQQLTEEGSRQIQSATNRIVYKLGEDGVLITWDPWERMITSSDKFYNELKSKGVLTQADYDELLERIRDLEEDAVDTDINQIGGIKSYRVRVGSIRTADELARWTFNNNRSTSPLTSSVEALTINLSNLGSGDIFIDMSNITTKDVSLEMEWKDSSTGATKRYRPIAKYTFNVDGTLQSTLIDPMFNIDNNAILSLILPDKWFTIKHSASTGFNEWQPVTLPAIAGNETIKMYAVIRKVRSIIDADVMYTVTFMVGGSTYRTMSQSHDSLLITPPNPSQTGVNFGGWKLSGTLVNPATYHVTSDITLNAYFNLKYTFDTQGGRAVTAVTKDIGQSYVLPTQGDATGTQTWKDFYNLRGWTLNGAATVVSPGSTVKQTVNTSCKAVWDPIKYTITIDKNGRDATDGQTSIQVTVENLGGITTFPSRPYYDLAGFSTAADDTGTKVYDGTGAVCITKPYQTFWDMRSQKTIYAVWDPYSTTINLYHDNATIGTVETLDEVLFVHDATPPTIPVPVKFGYTFGGYYTSRNGSGTRFADATGAYAFTGKVSWTWQANYTTTYNKLYAKWTAISKSYLELSRRTDGVLVWDSTKVLKTGSVTIGNDCPALTASAIALTRSGYTFGGYGSFYSATPSTADSGYLMTKYYNVDGTSAHIYDNPNSVQLYPIWIKDGMKYAVDITMAYADNGEKFSSSKYGSTVATGLRYGIVSVVPQYGALMNAKTLFNTNPIGAANTIAPTRLGYTLKGYGAYNPKTKVVSTTALFSSTGAATSSTAKWDMTVLDLAPIWGADGYTWNLLKVDTESTAASDIAITLTPHYEQTVPAVTVTDANRPVKNDDDGNNTYDFGGWKLGDVQYFNADGTVTTDGGATRKCVTIGNKYLQAIFIPVLWSRHVTNNGTTIADQRLRVGSSYTLQSPGTKNGYTFGGWRCEWGQKTVPVGTSVYSGMTLVGDDGVTRNPTAPSVITWTGKWNPNMYTITFNNQSATSGGTAYAYYKFDTNTIYSNTGCTTPFTDNKITAPTKTGYTFGGYFTGTGGGGTQYFTNGGALITSPTSICNAVYASSTLYAKWTANTYTITYQHSGSNVGTKTATYDSTIPTIDSATYSKSKTGYTFNGYYNGSTQWYDGSLNKKYNSSNSNKYNLTSGVILSTKHTANTYTVTLSKNGKTTTNTPTASVTATYDSAMPAIATLPTVTGYTFMGYYDSSATSGGNQYYTSSGGSVKSWDKANAATLYSRWNAKTYTMRIWSNMGTQEGASYTYKDYSITYDSQLPATITVPTITTTYWKFVGIRNASWDWQKPTTHEGSLYYNTSGSRQVSSAWTTDGDLNLYAHWEINQVTITWNPNGGSNNNGNAWTSSLTIGSAYGDLPDPGTVSSSFNRVFAGWGDYLIPNHLLESSDIVDPYETTYYAIWWPNFGTGSTIVRDFNTCFVYHKKTDKWYEIPDPNEILAGQDQDLTFARIYNNGWTIDGITYSAESGWVVLYLSSKTSNVCIYNIITEERKEFAYDKVTSGPTYSNQSSYHQVFTWGRRSEGFRGLIINGYTRTSMSSTSTISAYKSTESSQSLDLKFCCGFVGDFVVGSGTDDVYNLDDKTFILHLDTESHDYEYFAIEKAMFLFDRLTTYTGGNYVTRDIDYECMFKI